MIIAGIAEVYSICKLDVSSARGNGMLHYVLYSMKKRKIANLVTAGISIMLVLLLYLYFGSIRSYRDQIADLAENVPIYCQVSNLSGTLVNGLFTPKRIVDALEQSDQVKDLSYMTVMMAGEGDFKETEYSKYLQLYVVGANNVEAVGELTNEMISMEPELVDDFFVSDRMECIVNEKVLRKRGWEIGDQIVLKCYYYDASSEFHKLEIHPMGGVVEVKVVGTMEDIIGKTNAIATDVVLPAKTVQNIFAQFELPFFADTVAFHVKDPLNLGTFKEQMQEIGLLEISSEAMESYPGCALMVRDANFIESATNLRRVIELLRSFFPVMCVLVLMIGYVVSHLSGNSRRDEFALLRLQGVKKGQASLLFLMEQMILVLAGCLVGDIVMALTMPAVSTMAAVNGVIVTAYLIGAAAAFGRMSRESVVYLLSTQH